MPSDSPWTASTTSMTSLPYLPPGALAVAVAAVLFGDSPPSLAPGGRAEGGRSQERRRSSARPCGVVERLAAGRPLSAKPA